MDKVIKLVLCFDLSQLSLEGKIISEICNVLSISKEYSRPHQCPCQFSQLEEIMWSASDGQAATKITPLGQYKINPY